MPIDLQGVVAGSPWHKLLSDGTHRLGRSPSNEVVLTDRCVSGEHAEITVDGGSARVRDLGSRNGTWINDRRCEGEEPLAPGDQLRLGTVSLTVAGTPAREGAARLSGSFPSTERSPLVEDEQGLFASRALRWEDTRPKPADGARHGRQLLDALLDTGNFLVMPRPREELYDALLAAVAKVIPARRLALLLHDGPGTAAETEDLPPVRAARPALPAGESLLLSRTLLRTVLHERQSLLVVDARTDARYKDQASIVALDLRSAMVAPLFDNERVIGVLYADSSDPRVHFDDEQLRAFALLANLVAVKITNSRLLDDMRETERMAQELATAARIQRDLLPTQLPKIPGYEVAATLVPCFEAGGDLYEAAVLPDGTCILAVGDVSGKGMGAALIMSHTLAVLRLLQEEGLPLDETAARLHRHVYRHTNAASFVTFFLGRLDPQAGRLEFVNCGHNAPLLFLPAVPPVGTPHGGDIAQVRELEVTGLPLGMFPVEMLPPDPFASRTVDLPPGAVLAIFSDGIPEAMGPDGFYGDERLVETLRRHLDQPLDTVARAALADVELFRGATPASDDVTILLLRRTLVA
jgi:serine phosphatase RsbU (regulator of sigma subunit)